MANGERQGMNRTLCYIRQPLSLPDTYTVIDLETSGLNPCTCDIIEFGAMRVVNGTVSDVFSRLANPGHRINGFITDLTGISNDMLRKAPDVGMVLQDFLAFVGDSIVVGHNIRFDIAFLEAASMKLRQESFLNDYIDTMQLSRNLFPLERHHRLCDLIERFGIDCSIQHRALADVDHTNQCYQYMKQRLIAVI